MVKKVLIILIVIVVLLGLAIWAPWYKWDFSLYNLFGIENTTKYSELKVKSLSGEIDIYIDDELQGSVTDNEEFADIASISEGSHKITLKKKSSAEYYTFERTIDFESGVEIVIAYDLGPNEVFSEGHVFYSKKNYANDGQPKLFVYSVPDMTKVFIDDIFVGETPLRSVDLDLSSQHRVKLQKTGYDDLEFTILPDKIENREKLNEFDLIIEAKLFLRPVKIVSN